MRILFIYGIWAVCFLSANLGYAASKGIDRIILYPGNSYTVGNKSIVCEDKDPIAPFVTKDCQHYGGLNNDRCLYERKIHVYQDKVCTEECQFWDERGKRCNYSTDCQFIADQKIFLKTVCKRFDKFQNKCKEIQRKTIN